MVSSKCLAAFWRTRATSASVIGFFAMSAIVASIASRAGSIGSPSGICAKSVSVPGSTPPMFHACTAVAFFVSTSAL